MAVGRQGVAVLLASSSVCFIYILGFHSQMSSTSLLHHWCFSNGIQKHFDSSCTCVTLFCGLLVTACDTVSVCMRVPLSHGSLYTSRGNTDSNASDQTHTGGETTSQCSKLRRPHVLTSIPSSPWHLSRPLRRRCDDKSYRGSSARSSSGKSGDADPRPAADRQQV